MSDEIAPEVLAFYGLGLEQGRLDAGAGRLEEVRTREIVGRHLPPPPARVLDVGGGSGRYAAWLTGLGYAVRLLDPVPLHLEQARALGLDAQPGDARALEEPEASADAVLLLGPLYHLPQRADRVRCLREAARVARPGGRIFAAAISRFASLLDGLRASRLGDPAFAAIVREDLATGRHRNPQARPDWFTTAYFHRPEELAAEAEEAGLRVQEVLAVEGPLWMLAALDEQWADPAGRERLLEAARATEREPSLLGASAHFLLVAVR